MHIPTELLSAVKQFASVLMEKSQRLNARLIAVHNTLRVNRVGLVSGPQCHFRMPPNICPYSSPKYNSSRHFCLSPAAYRYIGELTEQDAFDCDGPFNQHLFQSISLHRSSSIKSPFIFREKAAE